MSDITFSDYTEQMRPMFVRLAEAVRENGNESEYENLALVIGAPDLDDLIGPAEREARFYVPVRVTIEREVYVYVTQDIRTRDADDEIDESDFITDHYSEIESLVLEEVEGSITDISVSQEESIHFEEWVD